MSVEEIIENPTPGQATVLKFEVGRHRFGYRLPKVGDQNRIDRLVAAKVNFGDATNVLSSIALGSLMRQAELEVGLMPRIVEGEEVNFGECAPSHWMKTVTLDDGKRTSVSFDNVDPAEFDAVCAEIDKLKKNRANSNQANSGTTAKE